MPCRTNWRFWRHRPQPPCQLACDLLPRIHGIRNYLRHGAGHTFLSLRGTQLYEAARCPWPSCQEAGVVHAPAPRAHGTWDAGTTSPPAAAAVSILRHQAPLGEDLIASNPVPTGNERHAHTGQIRLLDETDLFFRCPPPPALNTGENFAIIVMLGRTVSHVPNSYLREGLRQLT